MTARAVSPFYEKISPKLVRDSLVYMKLVKWIFTRPSALGQAVINTILKLVGKYGKMKGLMNQRVDNSRCRVTNTGLKKRYDRSIEVAVHLIGDFDESLRTGKPLDRRFDRNFVE